MADWPEHNGTFPFTTNAGRLFTVTAVVTVPIHPPEFPVIVKAVVAGGVITIEDVSAPVFQV